MTPDQSRALGRALSTDQPVNPRQLLELRRLLAGFDAGTGNDPSPITLPTDYQGLLLRLAADLPAAQRKIIRRLVGAA